MRKERPCEPTRRQGRERPEGEQGRQKKPSEGKRFNENRRPDKRQPQKSKREGGEWNHKINKKARSKVTSIIHPVFRAFVRIATLNIVTMTDKTTTIADFMNRHEIDALFLQETRLDELTAKSAEIAFQKLGFTLIPGTQAKDSRGRNAAGTAT
eukprot:9193258-Karenia_brevis.AAC.1